MQKTGRDIVKEVLFINQELGGEYEEDKQSRLDIVVITQSGERINIEMQLANKYNMFKRTMYYWAKLYEGQMKKGDGYESLLPTITINICAFSLFKDMKNYHSTYHLYEDSTLERIEKDNDVLEIHFIEMNKFLKAWQDYLLNPLNDLLARWLLLLGMVDARKNKVYVDIYKELEELAMKDENLQEALTVWENMSQTPETMYAYQSRLKYMLDEEAKYVDTLAKGKKEGIEIGKEEGIKEGIEHGIRQVIISLIENGFTDADIAQMSKQSKEYVQAIRSEMESK